MAFLKNLFGEGLPISELHRIQEQLTDCGVDLLLPGLLSHQSRLYEADILNLVEDYVTPQKGWHVVRGMSWCASGTNAHLIRYRPHGRGVSIGDGDKVVAEIFYEKRPESSSYLSVKLREAQSRLHTNLKEHTEGIFLLALTLSLNYESGYTAFLSLANVYLSQHPELQEITTVEDLADHIANAFRVSHLEEYLGECQYYAETFVLGHVINSKELIKHKAVINALCNVLECLKQRASYPTYQDIEGRIYGQMVQDAGNNVDGYWKCVHPVMDEDAPESFPFAYLCVGQSLAPADGPVLEGHRLYLHPFIRGVHYGFVVTVTPDGWTLL